MNAAEIIEKLGLVKLPEEGGFYKEVYRSTRSTDIYYLITPEEFSGLHRVKSSVEIFNFYAGDPAEMMQITPDGKRTHLTMGSDLAKGHLPKVIVPEGIWQGTRLLPGGKWALVGCTCIPAFEFSDFEGGDYATFSKRFPAHAAEIKRFTHS